MHLVWTTAAHFHGVMERPRPMVATRERSMPLPPMEGATFCTLSKEGLVPVEEPK